VLTGPLEAKAGTYDQVLHRVGDEHLTSVRQRSDPRPRCERPSPGRFRRRARPPPCGSQLGSPAPPHEATSRWPARNAPHAPARRRLPRPHRAGASCATGDLPGT
jgi:hypothetical protein